MADNRMFLCYRPTGDAVMLGKRLGLGYYRHEPHKLVDALKELFDRAENAAEIDYDDFVLLFETDNSWEYEHIPKMGEDPRIYKLKFTA